LLSRFCAYPNLLCSNVNLHIKFQHFSDVLLCFFHLIFQYGVKFTRNAQQSFVNIHGKHHIAILTSENGNYLPWLTVHFHDHDKQQRHCNEMPSHERRPHHMGYITGLHHLATSVWRSWTLQSRPMEPVLSHQLLPVVHQVSGKFFTVHGWSPSTFVNARRLQVWNSPAAQSQAVIWLVRALTEDSIIWTLTPQRSVNCF